LSILCRGKGGGGRRRINPLTPPGKKIGESTTDSDSRKERKKEGSYEAAQGESADFGSSQKERRQREVKIHAECPARDKGIMDTSQEGEGRGRREVGDLNEPNRKRKKRGEKGRDLARDIRKKAVPFLFR